MVVTGNFCDNSGISEYHVKFCGVNEAQKLWVTSNREHISADNEEGQLCVIGCYSANCGIKESRDL